MWIDYVSDVESPETSLLHTVLGARDGGVGDLVLPAPAAG
jgi:hypothetical protein